MPVKTDSKKAIAIMNRAGLKPLETYGGNIKPWKSKHLKCGRIVYPTLNAIKRGQGPCKYCAGKAVYPPDAVKLFLSKGLKPVEPYPGDNKKPWKCIHLACGNEVSPKYAIVARGESMGCHHCSDQFVDPDEAYQFFMSRSFQPLTPYPGSSKPWKSIHLVCGSKAQPSYGKIKSGRTGCRVCSGMEIITQKRAIAFYRSKGLEPKEKFKSPHKPWKSTHTVCGREVSPRWASVQQGNSGCAYCSGHKVDMKEVKRILKENKLKQLVPYPGGKVGWRCIHLPCGREVSPTYGALRSGQGPCEFCSKNMVGEKEAYVLLKKNKYTPLIDFPGGSKSWLCIHTVCGTKVEVRAAYLRGGNVGCSFCAGTKPITAAQANKMYKSRGFKPLETFINVRTPIKSIHLVCGKKVSPTYGSLRSGSGCKYCSIGGINLLAPAYLYLITHNSLNSHKIGIGGIDSSMDRLEKHKKQGWKTYRQLDLDTAEEAYEIEQAVLTWLRYDLGLQQYLLPEQMPQAGHTETVDASEIDLATVWVRVEELSKKSDKKVTDY
jgi:hypothetical protein